MKMAELLSERAPHAFVFQVSKMAIRAIRDLRGKGEWSRLG